MAIIPDPRIDAHLIADVSAAEGDRLEAYVDTLGNWTIGRGHLLPKAAPGKSWAGFTISQDVDDRYFMGDLIIAWQYANRLPEWSKLDTACRQNALIEICFNIGPKWGAFVQARADIEAQNWQGVHDQLLNSLWAKQVGARATRIANYFLTGAYP
jgi:lysozyme